MAHYLSSFPFFPYGNYIHQVINNQFLFTVRDKVTFITSPLLSSTSPTEELTFLSDGLIDVHLFELKAIVLN